MKKKLIIGVIIAECYQYEPSAVIQGIIQQAFAAKTDVMFLNTFNNLEHCFTEHWKNEPYIFSLAESRSFDGFIYFRNSFKNKELIERIDRILINSQKPVLDIGEEKHKYFDTTAMHDFEAFEMLAEHLITVHNYKRIYCLTGPKKIMQAEERLQGYFSAMKKHGLCYDKDWYEYGDFWTNAPVAFADRIISGELEKPDAVMCGNDIMAAALIDTLNAGGIRVPEDIAVTGVDGYEKSKLTTIRKNDSQYGAEAFRRLYHSITGKRCKKTRDKFNNILIGSTCGCPPSGSWDNKSHTRKMQEKYEEIQVKSAMLFDIMRSDSIDELLASLKKHLYLIYCMKRFRIFLTDSCLEYLDGKETDLNFNGNKICEVLDCIMGNENRNSCRNELTDIPRYLSESNELPVAYFLSPLHFNDSFFGIAALSFGKKPMTYGRSYINFISFIDAAMEQLRLKTYINKSMHQSGLPNQKLLKKLQLIHNEMAESPEQKWTVDLICGKLNISRSYLQRMFKEYFGKTIFEELNALRLEKAKKYLLETDLPAADIAEKCGFSTYSFFVQKFRDTFGASPAKFRKHRKSVQEQ